MKKVINKILFGLIWFAAGILAILLCTKKKDNSDIEQVKKDKYEEINNTPASTIADNTPHVRDTIREGQAEYINRIKEYLSSKGRDL